MTITKFKKQLPTGVSIHPILFSTPMVQAILQGRKTQTRRIVNPQPEATRAKGKEVIKVCDYFTGAPKKGQAYYWKSNGCWNSSEPFKCPYGKPGDILWVRETWARPFIVSIDDKEEFFYKANKEENDGNTALLGYKWKPSIHMPFEAARIFLRIKSVRVERLWDISEADAEAEGVETLGLYPGYNVSSRGKFEGLWNSINGSESWDENPWVWVIEFERVNKQDIVK